MSTPTLGATIRRSVDIKVDMALISRRLTASRLQVSKIHASILNDDRELHALLDELVEARNIETLNAEMDRIGAPRG